MLTTYDRRHVTAPLHRFDDFMALYKFYFVFVFVNQLMNSILKC